MAKQTFGERLAQLREGKNWLQRDLAFRLNVKANTISNWEKGISRPNLEQICQLCQALSVTSDTLLGLDKTAMEQTLNLKEQQIISVFRGMDKETQAHLLYFLAAFGRINYDLAEKTESLESAERFIDAYGLDSEWKEEKQRQFP